MQKAPWLLVAAFLPAAALAATNPETQGLRQQIAALQIDHALNLSQQQAQAVLPLLQNAKAQVQAFEAQRAAAQPALDAALTQAVSDLKSTGTIAASTAKAVEAARPSMQTLRQDLRSTWQQVRQILTPAQLSALHSAQLGIPRSDGDSGSHVRDHPGFARRFGMMRAVLSDSFLSLVQARAA